MYDIIYINGKLTQASQMLFYPNDRGLLYGDGIFETVRIDTGSPRLLKQHWNRLMSGVNILDIHYMLTYAALNQAVLELLAANNLLDKDAIVRITLTRGHGPRQIFPSQNLDPTLLIFASSFHPPNKKEMTACLSTIRRNETSPLTKIKSLNYLDNILARREAILMGMDEAILLNTRGNVAETATANLFIVKEHTLLTPAITDGALPGITRQVVLEMATTLGFPAHETTISVVDLLNADEVFITNSVNEIMPLIKIEEKTLGELASFTMTSILQQNLKMYFCTSS